MTVSKGFNRPALLERTESTYGPHGSRVGGAGWSQGAEKGPLTGAPRAPARSVRLDFRHF